MANYYYTNLRRFGNIPGTTRASTGTGWSDDGIPYPASVGARALARSEGQRFGTREQQRTDIRTAFGARM